MFNNAIQRVVYDHKSRYSIWVDKLVEWKLFTLGLIHYILTFFVLSMTAVYYGSGSAHTYLIRPSVFRDFFSTSEEILSCDNRFSTCIIYIYSDMYIYGAFPHTEEESTTVNGLFFVIIFFAYFHHDFSVFSFLSHYINRSSNSRHLLQASY